MKHILHNDGNEYWFDKNWNYHRVDGGPAVIWSNGNESWRQKDKRHRKNNPSYIGIKGHEEWWHNGNKIKK